MYSRLNNIFVSGVLEAYWNVYEEIGLTRYTDLDYHNRVWIYHQKIVETIKAGKYSNSKKALLEHMVLLQQRTAYSQSKNHFE
jgi:DNA-binding FadR family transcriptional regulator